MKQFLRLCSVLLVLTPAIMQPVTINVNLGCRACVDIIISSEPIPSATIGNFFLDPAIIARYSFMAPQSNTLCRWEYVYVPDAPPMWVLPENHLVPALMSTNNYVIELDNPTLLASVGELPSEVYIRILQRTYSYDSRNDTLKWYAYSSLTNTAYPLNAVLNLSAQGTINPAALDTVPPDLQNIYIEATGSVS